MKRILIQLDTDPHPSSFDRVVAVDAGVDELFSYSGVTGESAVPLVHGAIFTRGPVDLKHTAIFVGGSDVAAGEALLKSVRGAFFGPMRVSVMMDSNGSNTTAAAAVVLAGRHIDLKSANAVVLGGTGPVGQRAAQLLAGHGARVQVASRSQERAESTCAVLREQGLSGELIGCANDGIDLSSANLLIAAGAAGVELLKSEQWRGADLKVAVDLNAVPPAGLEGVEAMDKAEDRDGVLCYGAIGVGGTKMKVHKRAVQRLFESNDIVLDTTAIYQIAEELERT